MHILILPSWYPGKAKTEGLFIFEQIIALGQHSDSKISIFNWGPNEYVIKLRNPIKSFLTLARFVLSRKIIINHSESITEYKYPHLTWSSLINKGNYESLAQKLKSSIYDIEDKSGAIDIIHAHVTFPAGYLAYKVAEYHRIPFVITEHSGPFPFKEFLTRKGLKDIIRIPLSKADKIIVVSNWLLARIKLYTENQPVVIPNSVDTDFFKPNQINRTTISKPQIFCLTKISEDKGIGDLLKAISYLTVKGYEFELRIGGFGPQERKYRNLASEYEIQDNINWLGTLSRKEALSEYNRCDFYVMPSRLESLSMVVLEAMACGKPVVATDSGGPADLIDENSGLLARSSDPRALAESIEKMLISYNQYNDDRIRNKCITEYSPSNIVKRLFEIFKESISTYQAKI